MRKSYTKAIIIIECIGSYAFNAFHRIEGSVSKIATYCAKYYYLAPNHATIYAEYTSNFNEQYLINESGSLTSTSSSQNDQLHTYTRYIMLKSDGSSEELIPCSEFNSERRFSGNDSTYPMINQNTWLKLNDICRNRRKQWKAGISKYEILECISSIQSGQTKFTSSVENVDYIQCSAGDNKSNFNDFKIKQKPHKYTTVDNTTDNICNRRRSSRRNKTRSTKSDYQEPSTAEMSLVSPLESDSITKTYPEVENDKQRILVIKKKLPKYNAMNLISTLLLKDFDSSYCDTNTKKQFDNTYFDSSTSVVISANSHLIELIDTCFDSHSSIAISANAKLIKFHTSDFKTSTSLDIYSSDDIKFYDTQFKAYSSSVISAKARLLMFYNTHFNVHTSIVISANAHLLEFKDTIFESNSLLAVYGNVYKM
ncbi:hypothetical protein GJ496_006044 [Pomphorhynchus laevis]|nr:hypothetical protein GJ496_006044 [Pomphorhynchus laevis]